MADGSLKDRGNNDPAFLRYYAAVLTREANARPGSNCQWMRDGAERALRRADELSTPIQGDLFAVAKPARRTAA